MRRRPKTYITFCIVCGSWKTEKGGCTYFGRCVLSCNTYFLVSTFLLVKESILASSAHTVATIYFIIRTIRQYSHTAWLPDEWVHIHMEAHQREDFFFTRDQKYLKFILVPLQSLLKLSMLMLLFCVDLISVRQAKMMFRSMDVATNNLTVGGNLVVSGCENACGRLKIRGFDMYFAIFHRTIDDLVYT